MSVPVTIRGLLWPVAVAAVLGVPIIGTLGARPPNIVDREIAPVDRAWTAMPVDLGVAALPDGTKVARVRIEQDRSERLAVHDEVHLLVVVYDGTPALIDGEIRIQGTDCAFRVTPGARLVNNGVLAFKRGASCGRPLHGQPNGQMDLTLTFRGPGHVGLWTTLAPATAFDRSWLTFSARDPAADAAVPVLRGRYADTFTGVPYRRIDLLAYAWQVSASSTWLWWLAGCSILSVAAGAWLIGRMPPASQPIGMGNQIATIWGGVFCIGLGLALLYAVLVPPLQAADEPDHMLSFGEMAGRTDVAPGIAQLARLGHFDRIRFRGAERFRPSDVGKPLAAAWGNEVFSYVAASRSATTWRWWNWLAPMLHSTSVPGSLLAIRIANAIVFALVLALAAAVLWWTSGSAAPAPHLVCVALLLVPTLPFFASYMSDYALQTSAFAFAAAMVAALFLDGRRIHLVGLPLGLSIAVILACGRSTLPCLPMLAVTIGGRALLGSSGDQSSGCDLRRSLYFWVGLAVGLAAFPLLSTPEFSDGLWTGNPNHAPERFKQVSEVVRRHPWILLLVTPVGFAVERVMVRLRRCLCRQSTFLRTPTALTMLVTAVLVGAALVTSLFVSMPHLVVADVVRAPSALSYARRVLPVALTGLRLVDHDFMLSSSFWAGYGWLDAIPGTGFVSLMVLLAALGAVATLVRVGRTRHSRRAAWIAMSGIGCVATLVAYSVSCFYLARSVHGRYLIGLYLAGLAVAWSTIAVLPRVQRGGRWQRLCIDREWVLLTLVAGIHAYALRFLLLRYY